MQGENIAKLDDLLARERAALLNAEYDTLAPLAALKEQYLHDLAAAPPSRKALAQLKVKMQNNLELTSAALRGVSAAKSRIGELQTVRDGFTTYDQSGNVALVPAAQHKVEKKA